MSTTSDFSVLTKKVLKEDVILRSSHSSIKKRPYFPKKKILELTPLDFNKIKREIEEAEKSSTINFEKVLKQCEQAISSSNEDNSAELSRRLKEDTCSKEHDIHNICVKEMHKENVELGKQFTRTNKDNDSFDLDFSVLSGYTPVKKETVPATPKKCTKQATTFNNFIPPKVNNVLPSRVHCSVPRNTTCTSTSKTLINKPEKVENSVTNNVICSIPRSIPNKTFERFQVNNLEYVILNLLGKGGSSQVYQCLCIEKSIIVAIKCVYLQNSDCAQSYLNEVKLLEKLQSCDKVIKLYDYEHIDADKKLLMVLEKGGEDFTKILKNVANQNKNIPLYLLFFYWMEMLQAVNQIHSHGVIHADLKPSNFLCGDAGLKLIDFGISSSVQDDMTSVFKTLPEGSCNYISPEAFYNDNPSPKKSKFKVHYKSDVWSLGCILYQLIYKRTPFQHLTKLLTKLTFIMDPDHKIEYPEAKWVPAQIINNLKKCLRYDVKSRPSVNELIEECEKSVYIIGTGT